MNQLVFVIELKSSQISLITGYQLTSEESKIVRPPENLSSKYAAVHTLVFTLPLSRHYQEKEKIISVVLSI